MSAGDSRSRIKTLERSGLSLAVYGGTVIVDDARVVEWGKEASNGVIHTLDALLQPVLPDFDPYVSVADEADGPVAGTWWIGVWGGFGDGWKGMEGCVGDFLPPVFLKNPLPRMRRSPQHAHPPLSL